ncbi:transcriptional regulator [Haloferax sp. S1W]|uniref:transcriptional regulator n=1 Tax=Haloferax sp. S1W TaxID=3377110 RepID=UPI0037C8CAF0
MTDTRPQNLWPLERPKTRQTDGSNEHLDEMPPSAALVYDILTQADEPVSSTEIASRTLLAPRTVRDALNRLQDAKLVHSRAKITDPRKRQYELTDDRR